MNQWLALDVPKSRLRRLRALLAACTLVACTTTTTDSAEPNRTDPRWVKQHSPHAPIALVFVHGLFGDTLGTWTHDADTSFFSLLSQDEDVGSKVDMFAFGYTSNMFKTGSMTIREAANLLFARLQKHDVLEYRQIVFVAHSMGGLVAMRTLLTKRELIERVPLLVLYGTPQEGAQIAKIASKIARNPSLAEMFPADQNEGLQLLNDEWRSLPAEERPRIQCAYEKRPTHGVMIVPWSGATRFCDDVSTPIDADHIQIVKPSSVNSDSLMVLTNALTNYVLGSGRQGLLLPDLMRDGERLVLNISDPYGKHDVRLVNADRVKLRYVLAHFPERDLYVIPGTGPRDIRGRQTETLQFVIGYGAEREEYTFELQVEGFKEQAVTVRVANPQTIRANRQRLARAVIVQVGAMLDDSGQIDALLADNAGPARQRLALAARKVVHASDPGMTEEALWIVAAETLNQLNWPDVAAEALRQAIEREPTLRQVASVQGLSRETTALVAAQEDPLRALTTDGSATFVASLPAAESKKARSLAARMKAIPALAKHGLSLEGDLKLASGDRRSALKAYREAAWLSETQTAVAHDESKESTSEWH